MNEQQKALLASILAGNKVAFMTCIGQETVDELCTIIREQAKEIESMEEVLKELNYL